jgi:tRNA(Ile)-lysidine synthase
MLHIRKDGMVCMELENVQKASLFEKVKQRIHEVQLIQPHDTIIVAVSGGPDSVALLHILHQLAFTEKWHLIVAHVNHQFRGQESLKEKEFVQQLAQHLQLPLETTDIDIPSYIKQTAMNAQLAAREKRYAFFHQLAQQYQAQKIALAHHADDQAETLMMRLLRGTGAAGLSGIPERRLEKKVELIRPFLRIYKSEIEAYCKTNQFSYCRDSSNEKLDYFRNQIRLEVLPYLKLINPKLPESLNRLSDILREEDLHLFTQTVEIYHQIVQKQASSASLSAQSFIRLSIAIQRRLIRHIVQQLSQEDVPRLDFVRLEKIRSAIVQTQKSNVVLLICKDLFLVKEYHNVVFTNSYRPASNYSYHIYEHSMDVSVPEINAKLLMQINENKMSKNDLNHYFNTSQQQAFFDIDQLNFPLLIRNRKPGDTIQLLGMKGTKKIKDVFIDEKVPPSLRKMIPILVDQKNQVLWVPHVRRSQHAIVKSTTQRVMMLNILPM